MDISEYNQIPTLVIHHVQDMATFNKMKEQGHIEPNELYLVGEEEIKLVETLQE